jgi:hypothetical protein
MLSVCLWSPPIVWMSKPVFIKLGMYITVPEPIWSACFHKWSMSLCVYVARQRLCKNITAATNIYETIELLLVGSFLCGPCRINRESVGLSIILSLLGNGFVNIFRRQGGIVGSVVFCAVCVVSKEFTRLVFPRTSCFTCSSICVR